MSIGSSPSALSDIRLTVIGAPGASDNDHKGFLEVIEASVSQHELISVSGRNMQIQVPVGGTEFQFGFSLAAANVNDCRVDPVSGDDYACGQELLVGAPDTFTHGVGGEVYVYEPNNDLSIDTVLVLAEVVYDPVGSPSGEFGHAIVAAVNVEDQPDDVTPWESGGITPQWVAIGAPGDERVEIFSVDPAAAATGLTALTHQATISNPVPTQAEGFGATLAFANLDQQAVEDPATGVVSTFPELVVGAPRGAGGGMVFVYQGIDPSTGSMFGAVPEILTRASGGLYPTSVLDDSFGEALAAGSIAMPDPDPAALGLFKEALLVGAPTTTATDPYGTTYSRAGAMCQFALDADPTRVSGLSVVLSDCMHNVFFAADEEWGAAIAVGNFGAADGSGGVYTDAAYLRDVAVGAPGGGFGRGYVEVYLSQVSGFDVDEFLTAFDDPTGSVGDEYGRTLATGYVGQTTWGDLLVGAPGGDEAHLTRAVDSGTRGCPELDGWWAVDGQEFIEPPAIDTADTADTAVLGDGFFLPRETEFILWEVGGSPILYFQSDYTFNIVDSSGEVCTFVLDGNSNDGTAACDTLESVARAFARRTAFSVQTIVAGTSIDLGATCSAAFDGVDTYTWTNVPVGNVIQGNMDPALWAALDSGAQNGLLATLADVTVELGTHPPVAGTTATVEIDIDWDVVWANVHVGNCNVAFAKGCNEPAANAFTGALELPAPAEHSLEQVCED